MNKNQKLYNAINSNRPDMIDAMFHSQEIDIVEYETAKKALEEKGFIDLSFTPEKNAEQFKRASRFYNILIVIALIDIVPMLWMVLFFIYIPCGIYLLVVAFGKDLILPDEAAVREHSFLRLFIVLSLIPAVGIIADILILIKAFKLKSKISEAIIRYTAAYEDQIRISKSQDN